MPAKRFTDTLVTVLTSRVLYVNLIGFVGLAMLFCGLWLINPAYALAVVGTTLVALAVLVGRAA